MPNGSLLFAFQSVFLNALRDAISGAVAPASLYVLTDYVVSDYVE